MADYYFSQLSNNATITFDPAVDRFFFDNSLISAADVGYQIQEGGEGNHSITLLGKTITVSGSFASGEVLYLPSALIFSDGSQFIVGDASGVPSNDQLTGTAHDDFILGLAGNDTMSGGAGDDVLSLGLGQGGTYGHDTVDGGAGFDRLVFTIDPFAGGVHVNLQAGTVVGGDDHTGTDSAVLTSIEAVTGTQWGDVLVGSDGNDSLDGGAGDDTLQGGNGDDTLKGGAGDDVLDGGTGIDWADYATAPGGVIVDLQTGTAAGADGHDTLSGIENVSGSTFDDTLTGDAGDNVFAGLEGHDVIDGGAGNDTVHFGWAPSAAVVNLAAGSATGAWGSETLASIEGVVGSQYADTITGGSGADNLDGESGNDLIDGGAGNDLLDGRDGDDTLIGGPGDDTLIGGLGNDTAVFDFNVAAYEIVPGASAGNYVVSGPEGVDVLTGIEVLEFADGVFVPSDGTPAADTLTGGAQDDFIRGHGGNDHISGGGGDDALFGDEGDDSIEGGDGNDYLDGGTGNDTMAGGSGDDTYVVDSPGDVVQEYPGVLDPPPPGAQAQVIIGSGIDKVIASIDYTLGQFIENLALAEGTANLSGTGNDQANVIDGNAGDNTLTGLAGDDEIDGGAGIDTSVYSGTRSQYTVTHEESGWQVSGGSDGTDSLQNVERLQFSNMNLALDLDGNAGEVARILGAVFGPAAVNNQVYAGIGLDLVDGGMSYETLMGLALTVELGPNASSKAVVDLLYNNVIGVAPPPGDEASFMSLIDNHILSAAQLGVIAAQTSFTAQRIGLPDLMDHGLEYV